MKKIFVLLVSLMVCGSVFAAKPTSWTSVRKVVQTTVLEPDGDGKYNIIVKTKAMALSPDGGTRKIEEKTQVGATSYTLPQVYNNWNALATVAKAEFKNVVQQAIDEDVD